MGVNRSHSSFEAVGYKIVASGMQVIVSRGIGVLASTAGVMFFARTIEKSDFAVFAVFSILTTVIEFSTALGLEATVLQLAPAKLVSENPNNGLGLMKTALLSRTALLGFASILLAIWAEPASRLFFHTTSRGHLIGLIAIGVFMSGLFSGLSLLAQAVQLFGPISLFNAFSRIAQNMFAVLFYFRLGLEGAVLGMSIGPLIGIFGLLWHLRKYLFNSAPFVSWKWMVRYSVPFYIRMFALYGFTESDRLLIGVLLPPAALAEYSIAAGLAAYLNLIGEAFLTPMLVKVAEWRETQRDRVQRSISKVYRYTWFIIFPLCAAVALSSRWLLFLYGGEQYERAWLILTVLALAQFIFTLRRVAAVYLFSLGEPRQTLKLDGISGLLAVFIGLFLGYWFAQIGIAVGQMFSAIISLILAVRLLRNYLVISFSAVYGGVRQLIVPALLGSIILTMGQIIYFSLWAQAVYLLFAAITFGLLLRRQIAPDDRAYIRGVFRFFTTKWSALFVGQ
jgi:O-antigen/teichoic acid export membrane protein